jgi:argininosuccinate synthase
MNHSYLYAIVYIKHGPYKINIHPLRDNKVTKKKVTIYWSKPNVRYSESNQSQYSSDHHGIHYIGSSYHKL